MAANTLPWGALIPGGFTAPPGPVPATLFVLPNILYPAFRIAGILRGAGRGLSIDEINDGFQIVNDMLDGWNIERLILYQILRNVYTVNPPTTPDNATLMGPGASDINAPRPTRIDNAGVVTQVSSPIPVELPLTILTPDNWAVVRTKNTPSTLPTQLYPDYGDPIMRLYLFPVLQQQIQLALYTWFQFVRFQTVNDGILLPPGYLKAIQYNLAVELAARPWNQIGQPNISQLSIGMAYEMKSWVKAQNVLPIDLCCDRALLGDPGQYNWITDQPVGRGVA